MLSNQLLTGQEVGGALVPEDAGNVLQVAVNRLLRGVKTRQANGIFATHLCLPVLADRPGRHWRRQNTMTASPLGSPTAESPQTLPAMTLEEWKARPSRWHWTFPKYGRRSWPPSAVTPRS